MSRPQFFLVAGPNGAGKSTLSIIIKRRYLHTYVIDPDNIAKEMTGSFSSVATKQLAAGKEAIVTVKQCIGQGRTFLIESTISGTTYLKYAKQAREGGFRTTLIFVGLSSPQLSSERVSIRVKQGGHAIPVADAERRYPRTLANLKAHIDIFESAHIYDNSQSYQWIADYREGKLHRARQPIPQWIEQYLP